MPYSVSTLLTRNLTDVFGENDSARRRVAIEEIFTEDCVFYEPAGVHRGRDEIDRVAAQLRTTHSDFRYQQIALPEELGNAGRIRWVEGRPGEAPILTPELISSLFVTDGLLRSISFSINCPDQRKLGDFASHDSSISSVSRFPSTIVVDWQRATYWRARPQDVIS